MPWEEEPWNVFRSHKRSTQQAPSVTPWIITAIQLLKLLMFIAGSVFLTAGVIFSKVVVLLLATNVLPLDQQPSPDGFQQSCSVHTSRNGVRRAAMFLSLALLQCLPDLAAVVQSLLRVRGGTLAGRVINQVICFEACRALGLSLLVFVVLPQLDLQRGLVLLFCLPLISVIQRCLGAISHASRNASSFFRRIGRLMLTFPRILSALLVFSSTYLWSIMDVEFQAKAALPFAILFASLGFWESWVLPQHEGTAFHRLFEVKYGLTKLNPSTRIAQSLLRIFIILVVMFFSSSDVKGAHFWRVVSSYSLDFVQTQMLLLALGVVVLHSALRYCARFLSAMNMRMLLIFHPTTIAPLLLVGLFRYVCSQNICGVAKPFASLGLSWRCDVWGDNVKPFNDWYLLLFWLWMGTYRAFRYVIQEDHDNTDEVIYSLSPSTIAFCVDQSLVVFQHAVSKKLGTSDVLTEEMCCGDEKTVRNDDVDGAMTLYICATMWHETTTEMTQMMRSILRLDEEHIRRRNNKKPGQVQFQLEAHIFFDDAWTTDDVGRRVPNEFFELFFTTLNELTGEHCDEHGRLASRVLVNTPYGGRLVVKLPAGTLLFVHLKDKTQIRHKKRWSQVMYMYYLLGHRIMDSALSLEDRQQMAEKTFILAIDGDSKFEPEAVVRLLSLMQQKNDIGCACGRIHPIGSGIMVWYQKFEYAIAHWFQKAAEHVFGCVLCAPGCFSLFRASALMDDNIMHKYTKTAEEPRHFVQYDQGEDRWLSTLMLKQGYRIEYAAASDAETYAPEGFEEFFNQRRRWTPSSIANTVDLLMDYKRASENNESISYAYIAYQFLVIAFSMLGPAIIFSMVVYAQVAAFGADTARMMLYNGLPIVTFVFLCFTTESNIQLWFAKMMSIVYAFVMLAVLVATSSQIVLETVVSPTSMFILAMVLIFFSAACLHPCEFSNIIYGSVFFLMIPSTYVFLSLYSLINLNVINWGTREAVAKATGQANEPRGLQKWLKQALGILCRVLPSRCGGKDPQMEEIQRKMEEMEKQMSQWRCGRDDQEPVREDEEPREVDEVVTVAEKKQWDSMAWMDVDYLAVCERGRLKTAEFSFWKELIEKYLKPKQSSPEAQKAIADGLASLRNQIAFVLLLLNALLALAIYLIQRHKNVLSINWTPYDGFKWTKMNEMNGQFEETEDPLKIDPLGMGIIVFLMGILVVQTIGMLIHRMNTLIGAFQEVDQMHELLYAQTKKHSDDERILSAARQMLDTCRGVAGGHAADGYTRHTSDAAGDEHVLFKLQRARLAAKLKQSGALPSE